MSVEYMAPKRTDDQVPAGLTPETEVPAGWTLEPEVPAGLTPETEVPAGWTLEPEVPAGLTPETEVPAGCTLEPEVPAGWTRKTEVQKDGSKKVLYSCSGTGQQFHTHADFSRYVRYAKKDRVGIYAPSNKSVKRKRYWKNNRKTSAALSIRMKPSSSNSNSLTAEKRTDSKSSSSRENTDEEKNEDVEPYLDDVDRRLLDEPDWGILMELVYNDFCLA